MKNRRLLPVSYAMALLFLVVPFFSFTTRGNFFAVLDLELTAVIASLKISLVSSVISMLVIVLVGIPAGYYMARVNFRFKAILDALFSLPQILPPAVIGLLLLFTYGSNGFIGQHLTAFGIRLSFSLLAVILTFVFVALPLFINGCMLAFSRVDVKLEQVAAVLGDSPWQVFFRVTLPLAKKGILVSLLMSWSRGLAEFGATMMFAGNLPGVTQTLPLAIFNSLETNVDQALFLAFVMFVVAIIVLISVQLLSKE